MAGCRHSLSAGRGREGWLHLVEHLAIDCVSCCHTSTELPQQSAYRLEVPFYPKLNKMYCVPNPKPLFPLKCDEKYTILFQKRYPREQVFPRFTLASNWRANIPPANKA